MNLKQAQQKFLQDAKYRQQYDKQKDGVELAMQIQAIRKELGINHLDLAQELGISRYDISKFEGLRGRVEPWVVSALVTRFQNELSKRGIQIEKWLVAEPMPQPSSRKNAQDVGPIRKSVPCIEASRNDKSTALPTDRQRLKSKEEEKDKA